MKLTNKYNVHPVMEAFLSYSDYDYKDIPQPAITPSQFHNGIQQTILQSRYHDQIVEDVSDRVWAVFGSAVHAWLEKVDLSGLTHGAVRKEERLSHQVNGMYVSGKFDIAMDSIHDIKTAKCGKRVWGIVKQGDFITACRDWREQLSLYRWLCFKVKGIKLRDVVTVHIFYKDHDDSLVDPVGKDVGKARRILGNHVHLYPKLPIESLEMPALPFIQVDRMVEEKVEEYKRCVVLQDNKLPSCTDEQMWDGRKKCLKYCNVSAFCHQHQEYLERVKI